MFVFLSCAIAILFLLHELTIAGGLGFPVDESWIDQVYARNFFRQVSFEFNAAERTPGPTAPFWTVFLAIGVGLFHDPLLTGKLLGSIFLFLTGYYVFRLFRVTDHDYGTSLLGGALTMTISQLAWAELSGLESCLATALVSGGLWWYFANPSGWRKYLTGAVFAVAALTRPETTILFALLLIHDWRRHRTHPEDFTDEHWIRDGMFMLGAYMLVIIPVALTNIALSGSIVPETFFAGLTKNSLPVLLRHGRIGDLFLRLITSVRAIPHALWEVYVPVNPVFAITIALAWVARRKDHLFARHGSDAMLGLSTFLLVMLPYVRAVLLGVDNSFGEHGRWMHFVLPIYTIGGVASVHTLVRLYVKRVLRPRSALFGILLLTLLSGYIYLGLRAASPSFTIVQPAIDWILLSFFSGLLFFVAYRYAGERWFKPELVDSVTEAERNRYTFKRHEDTDLGMPERLVRILRASLLITLAWNVAQLPRAANDFGNDVASLQAQEMTLARSISQVTAPTDVIATNAIGGVAWVSDRRVVDIQGRLEKSISYNARLLGPSTGLLKTLIESRPQYLALIGDQYHDFVAAGLSAGFLNPVFSNHRNQAFLYRLDFQQISALKGRLQ